MANTPKKNRVDVTAADQQLIDGFNKNGATIPTILIGGAPVTTKDIVATLQSRIDAAKAVVPARATWQTLVQAERDERNKTKAFVSGVKQSLLVAFAGRIDTLADFGLIPRKVANLSPEQKVARTEKVLATRKARHTMGSKQKADIHGTVAPTAPVNAAPTPTAPVTPVASPPVAASPSPASPAPVVTAPVTTPHAS